MLRIWVGSLSDYNNGILHGCWIDIADANGDKETLFNIIKEKVLATSPTAAECGCPTEEFGVFDYDSACHISLSQFGEYPDYQELIDLDSALEAADDPDAIAAYLDLFSIADLDQFEDRYCGHYDSHVDFASELIDDLGDLNGVPDYIARYFDYESFARDLFLCDYCESDGYVFRNC